MSLKTITSLVCDICGDSIVWDIPVSKTMTRHVGKVRGWRVDKLNRDICDKHKTLKPRRNDHGNREGNRAPAHERLGGAGEDRQ